MKKFISIIVLVFILASCQDFLEREPQNTFTVDNYYSTVDECLSALNTVYNALWTANFHIGKFMIGDILSDDATKGGENDSEWAELNAAMEFRMKPNEEIGNMMWGPCYTGLCRANFLIDILKDKHFDQEIPSGYPIVDRMIGECKFIRAFFSYYLVTVFGEVPYFTVPTVSNIPEALYESVPREIIWEQIEKDLYDAVPVLPSRGEYDPAEWGRITTEAASAMLGKVLLFEGKYDAAAIALRPVLSNSQYSLMDNYGQIFDKGVEFSKESIFEIPFGGTQSSFMSQGDGALGQSVYQFMARRNGDDGWGYNNPTDDLVEEFEEGDPRLIYTVIFPGDEFEAGKPQVHSVPKYAHFSRKQYLTKEERVPDYGNVDVHYRIIRLADVYLMYAEACLLGTAERNIEESLLYLNKVRERANRTPKKDVKRVVQQVKVSDRNIPMRVYTTDEQLLKDIKHERRVELAMEGNRWWDLLRWSDTDIMSAYYKKWGARPCPNGTMDYKGKYYDTWISRFSDGKYPVFPIPQTKIDGTDGKIHQSLYY